MDLEDPKTLEQFLEDAELKQIPEDVQKKIQVYIEQLVTAYCREKASETLADEYQKKVEDLQNELKDFEVKVGNYEQLVIELREQLNQLSTERVQMLETMNSHEIEVNNLRKEKNELMMERDKLLRMEEHTASELEHLKHELQTLKQQLNSERMARCEAVTRLGEIESKELAMQLKERRLEQEQSFLQNENHVLKTELNRYVLENQNLRRESSVKSMQIQTQLTDKTNELQITYAEIEQKDKIIHECNEHIVQLRTKAIAQSEQMEKYIENYKQELDAKTKLAEIYKTDVEHNETQKAELVSAINELKGIYNEAKDRCGQLENELKEAALKYENELEEKEKVIEDLRNELVNANVLIKQAKEESVENAISTLAPTAAIASRLIRTDMTLTELYSLYAKNYEDLEEQKRQNSHLQLQMSCILEEVKEQAPIIVQKDRDYKKVVDENNALQQQRDKLLEKERECEDFIRDAKVKVNHLERENARLTRVRDDMARQLTCILTEVEHLRIGIVANNSFDNENCNKSLNDSITKKLVTFTQAEELIENNHKLLGVVRDLTDQIQELKRNYEKLNEEQARDKLNCYADEMKNIQDTLKQKDDALNTMIIKCERYKQMYFNLQKNMNTQRKHESMEVDENVIVISDDQNVDNVSYVTKKKSVPGVETRLHILEQQLADANEKYKSLKEQYDYYKTEKQNNDKLMQEQFDAMRTELRELTTSHCKVANQLDLFKEQNKQLQRNIATYKQQITTLEARTKNYESTIIKHEQTTQFLKDELITTQRKSAAAEGELGNLRSENRFLKETSNRINSERELLLREQQSQALLLNSVEFIKANLERVDAEGKMRLEKRLDDTLRELSAQRRHFNEEEERFREIINEYKRETETAKKQMEDEKQQANKLRNDLLNLRKELATKVNQIDELSKKLQDSLTPSKDDNPIVLAHKHAREYQNKFEKCQIELETMKKVLENIREDKDRFYNMSVLAEKEIKKIHDIHTAYIATSEKKIEELQKSEANFKNKIADLEAETQLLNVTESCKNTNQSDQLKTAMEDLKNTLVKYNDANATIRSLRSEISSLNEAIQNVEQKYANEMTLHSSDIQELTKIKAEFITLQDQSKMLAAKEEIAQSSYNELKKSHEESQRLLQNEREENEKRFKDLHDLNANLHDQIEALTSKLYMLTQSGAALSNSSAAVNESAMDLDLSQSKLEDEDKSNEQLHKIIKFLRKEKEISFAKLEIVRAENSRLLSELKIMQQKIEELNTLLNQERSKAETSVVSTAAHEEVLRKVEFFNALNDSNRILREEKNSLAKKVAELNSTLSNMEKEIFPLRREIVELKSRVDDYVSENAGLRTEAIKWRQRANSLVEKSNKNPEEFKRLQMERENLAKMLTNEKELLRKANEELAALKARFETEMPAMNKQLQALNEDRKRMYDESMIVKDKYAQAQVDLVRLRNTLQTKDDDLRKALEEVQSKENQLVDVRNKELQIRKIAKRYKDSYTELCNKSQFGSAENEDINTNNSVEDNTNATVSSNNNTTAELDQLRTLVEEQSNQITQIRDELESVLKENVELKLNLVSEEKLLLDAKNKITEITEKKNKLVENIEALKASYEGKIARLEKELQEQAAYNKETSARLTRENETLHLRINQLSRQLGLQQSAKPSTSTVTMTEKGNISESSPRTANVKPMSGSATVQQSATVTPWRGGETPLASIRPISVQNSRTAAILPTSQQTSAGSSSTTSSSTSSSSSAPVSGSSSTSTGNTALVPPQQQVHTTGSTSLELMASSSPTSSHTDYMPSTSSAAVAVAAIPPMGTATVAESSQEAESVQQPQQNDAQLYVSGGQQQVVALVSPRVEGSSSTSTTTTTTQNPTASPNMQLSQDANIQQPSTSGSSSSSSTVVSSHSRHTPSSSNVTTTQAGCSSNGHKRPRDLDGDSTNVDESVPEKICKRMRAPIHSGDSTSAQVGDSGIDADQMPTSSQRDQEDDIVVVDSEEEGMGEVDDDGPVEGGDAEQEGYEDSYEQDNEIDENEGPEAGSNEDNMQIDEIGEQDNNEVDVEEEIEQQEQCTSGSENQNIQVPNVAEAAIVEQDNQQQQSQAISSGSCESVIPSANIPQSMPPTNWKQASSTSGISRRPLDNNAEIGSSPQEGAVNESNAATGSTEKIVEGGATSVEVKEAEEKVETNENAPEHLDIDADEDFAEETSGTAETTEKIDSEGNQSSSATQSEIQDNQCSQVEVATEDIEGTDGVSSEGEKQPIEGVEEEGREAEASTSASINTRSKAMRGSATPARRGRISRGTGNRPTPIVWQNQDSPGNSRSQHNLRNQEQIQQSSSRTFNPVRGGPRGRRLMRRPPGGNYPNMRYP